MPARGSKQTLEKKAKPKYEKIDTNALPPLYKCTCCGKMVQELTIYRKGGMKSLIK